ncbi:MAG: ATP-binding protein, partial [Dehalococcoidia bacterium]
SSAQERDRLLAALDSSVNAVLAVDSEGQISFANVAAERLFERPRDDLLGNSVAWVLPDEQVIDAVRQSRQEGRAETCVIERPGRQYLEVFSTPIIGGDWVALLMFHDITDVKRTEQVRRDFVANVSHELRTPLASIKSVIETLQAGALDDKRAAKDFLRRAEGEADRLVQLVEELLELSRIEAGVVPLAREPVEIDAVLNEAVNRLMPQAIRRQVSLTLDTKDDLPAVIGDATRLERVALNLIHNAIKFTPAGGSINVSANYEDNSVIVRVRDTGLGIEPEQLPRIFERFYKTDRSRESVGTGLGLAVVKHTVEAHGGVVRVESVTRHGTTFSFTLPIAHP